MFSSIKAIINCICVVYYTFSKHINHTIWDFSTLGGRTDHLKEGPEPQFFNQALLLSLSHQDIAWCWMQKELLITLYLLILIFQWRLREIMKLLVAKHHTASHAQPDSGASRVTFKSDALNTPSCALPNVPVSKDHTDAGTGNTSVLGNYPVPRVIDRSFMICITRIYKAHENYTKNNLQ